MGESCAVNGSNCAGLDKASDIVDHILQFRQGIDDYLEQKNRKETSKKQHFFYQELKKLLTQSCTAVSNIFPFLSWKRSKVYKNVMGNIEALYRVNMLLWLKTSVTISRW